MEKYKDQEWLSKQYDKYPIEDIASECGVSNHTIYYWLNKLDVASPLYNKNVIYNDEEWLKEHYLGKGMSVREIANLDVCDVGEQAIRLRLIYFSIDTREKSNPAKYSRAQGVDPESKHLDAAWLREQYVDKDKTDAEIASMDCVDVNRSSVGRVRRSYSIDSDYHISECDSHGFSYGPNWNNITKRIRKRDDYMCQDCKITQREYLDMFDMKLDVHHKRPVTEFKHIHQANRDENLVTLCRRCHKEVEEKRKI